MGMLGWARGGRKCEMQPLPLRCSESSREDNTQTRTTVFHGKVCCGERCARHCGNQETRRTHSAWEASGKASWKWAMAVELYLEKESSRAGVQHRQRSNIATVECMGWEPGCLCPNPSHTV